MTGDTFRFFLGVRLNWTRGVHAGVARVHIRQVGLACDTWLSRVGNDFLWMLHRQILLKRDHFNLRIDQCTCMLAFSSFRANYIRSLLKELFDIVVYEFWVLVRLFLYRETLFIFLEIFWFVSQPSNYSCMIQILSWNVGFVTNQVWGIVCSEVFIVFGFI